MNDRYSDGYQTVIGVGVVQVLGGFVGQLRIADEVVWQGNVYEAADDARREATEQLKNKMKELFA